MLYPTVIGGVMVPALPQACLSAVAASLALAARGVSAQAPLSIEQLLAPSARWQLVTTIDHASSGTLPFEERRSTRGSMLLRYGLTARLEVSGRLSRRFDEQRSPDGSSTRRGRAASIGLAWLARREDRWPALLLEARADVQSRFAGSAGGAGEALAFTTYRSVDPVVLSLSATWARQRSFRQDDVTVDPGQRWRIEPLVSFAVNSRVTLLGGASITRRTDSRIDGRTAFGSRSTIRYRSGLGYAPDSHNTLFLTADLGGGDAGARIALQWFYEF